MAEDYANTAGLHKSEISPLPWLDTDRNDNPQTMDPYIKIDNEHSGIAYVFGDTKAEREANATYIVKAANEYPKLVEQRDTYAEDLDALQSDFDQFKIDVQAALKSETPFGMVAAIQAAIAKREASK